MSVPNISANIAPSTTANSQGAGAGNGIAFTPFPVQPESTTLGVVATGTSLPLILGGIAVLGLIAYLAFRKK